MNSGSKCVNWGRKTLQDADGHPETVECDGRDLLKHYNVVSAAFILLTMQGNSLEYARIMPVNVTILIIIKYMEGEEGDQA